MKTKQILKSDLVAKPGEIYQYTEITGYIDARGADTKTAFPKLTSVGGAIYARGADTKTAFPKLTSVGGYIYASGADTKTAFPKLTSVGGYIDARGADTKTAFPKLTSVGGSIYASGADTKTAFPKLTSVGCSIDASGADTKTAFPKLTSVGCSIDASGEKSSIKQNDPCAMPRCSDLLSRSFSAAGFSFTDGVLARIVSMRGRVLRVVICGATKTSYLVTDGNAWSHGETLAAARDSLLFKIGSRDTTEFKSWSLDKLVSKKDAIRAYRIITGACEGGVKNWLGQRKTPEKLTVRAIVDLTRGAFGHETFREFVTAAK